MADRKRSGIHFVMRHARGVLITTAALAILVAVPVGGIYLGRQVSWFEIDRVEVSGAHLVAPHELLRVSGIQPGQSILDNAGPWEKAISQHPVVTGVWISRRPLGTLRIRIQEKEPVAFVDGDVLALATTTGEILQVDPTAAPEDLPIVRGSLEDSTQAPSVRRLLAETGRLAGIDARLIGEISEISVAPQEEDVLLLVHPMGDILLPFGASNARLAQLRAVLTDLAARQPIGGGSAIAAERTRVDLRYEEQVVVHHPLPRELS